MSEITSYNEARETINSIKRNITKRKPVFTNKDIVREVNLINEIFSNLKKLDSFLAYCEQHEIQLERRGGDWM